MEPLIEFIRNFSPENLDLGIWDILTILGAIIVTSILFNWLISYLQPRITASIKKYVKRTLFYFTYGVLILLFLNAIMTGNYVYIFSILIPLLANKIDILFSLYDKFMDRKINNNH